MAAHRVKGLAFASVYVDDFEKAYRFYAELLGLEKEYDMGTAACFFKLPDNTGLYLQGKNRPASYAPDTARAAFVFSVDSTVATHERLKAAGVKPGSSSPMLLPEYRRKETVEKKLDLVT